MAPVISKDIALLGKWHEMRDADAFSEIVSRHSGMVYGACMRILRNAAAAEDVTQECFIELASTRTRIRSALGGWLHKAATHRSLDRLRTEKHRKERETRFVQKSDSYAEPTWDDVQDSVDEAIAALPEKLRSPIVAHFFEGQTYDSIASETGAPRSTVSSRVQRGISLIRKALNQKGISASVAALAAALAQGAAKAAPAPITMALTKLAIAGAAGLPPTAITGAGASTAAKWMAIGGIEIMKKTILVSVGIILLVSAGAYLLAFRPGDKGPTEDPPAAAAVATSIEQPSEYREQEDPAEVEPSPSAGQEQEKAWEEEATAPAPVKPASLSGHVMDDDGYSVADALIRLEVLQGPSGVTVLKTYSARSSADGTYAIAGIETFGHADLYASANGYAMGKSLIPGRLDPGTDLKDVNFTLKKARHVVAGRVATESGHAVPGATIELRYYGYHEVGVQETATTRVAGGMISDGKFSFASSDRSGHFMIAVGREGLCDFTVTKSGYGPGFFSRIPTGTEDALFVLLSPGAISGRVLRQDGSAVPGAQVEVTGYALPGGQAPGGIPTQSFRLPSVTGQADESGRYEVGPLGADYAYRVAARTQGTAETAWEDGIRVQAGETTENVDLVMGSEAVVHGRVTVAGTGQPVYPFGVFAEAKGPDNEVLGTMANTDTEGRYEFTLPIDGPTAVRVFWRYVHSSGYGPLSENSELATLELRPGATKELNFSIQEAPFSVTMRFVGDHGQPLPGVLAGIHLQDRGWGWQGSRIASDSGGYAAWHGLVPGETYVALGFDQEFRVIGRSARFTGKPAETVEDVVVPCLSRGGFEGIFTDSEGTPMSGWLVACWAFQEDGTLFRPEDSERTVVSSENGAFVFLYPLPEGKYPRILVVAAPYDGSDETYLAELSGLEIGANTVTDVGTLSGQALPTAEVRRMLQ